MSTICVYPQEDINILRKFWTLNPGLKLMSNEVIRAHRELLYERFLEDTDHKTKTYSTFTEILKTCFFYFLSPFFLLGVWKSSHLYGKNSPIPLPSA